MAKTKKTKFQTYPQPYQYGGLNLPFLDQYTNLNNTWNKSWRTNPFSMINDTVRKGSWMSQYGTDNYKAYTDPNSPFYDVTKFQTTSTTNTPVTSGPAAGTTIPAGSTIYNENYYQSMYNHSAPNHADYTNALKNDINSDPTKFPSIEGEKINNFNNHVAGIFSGLNYMNSYVPPEKINLQKGTKGVMYSQYGAPVKGPGIIYSPMLEEFGGIKTPASKWAHFSSGDDAIRALDNLLFSGKSNYYTPDTKVSDALNKYSGGDYSKHKYGAKKLKNLNGSERIELLNDIIKKEVSASNYAENYAGAIAGRQIGPSITNYQVTSRQEGGNINLEGYTPGTPSMNNDMNEIPSGDITMEQTPIPLLAIGKGGADNGLLKVLQPQSKGYNFKSKSTVEIPLEQIQKDSTMAKYGKLIKALNSYNNGGYISQVGLAKDLIGNRQFGGLTEFQEGGNVRRAVYQAANQRPFYQEPGIDTRFMPDARFNRPSIYGNSAIYQGAPNQLRSASMIPTINPTVVEPMSGLGFNRDNLAAQMSVSNNVKLAKGGTRKVAAYQQMLVDAGYNIEVDGAWGPRTQAAYESYTNKKAPSKAAVNSGKAKVASNITKVTSNTGAPFSDDFYKYAIDNNRNATEDEYNFFLRQQQYNGAPSTTPYQTFDRGNIPSALNYQVTDNSSVNPININNNTNSIISNRALNPENKVFNDYYSNPQNRYNGPQFGPPVGTLSKKHQDEILAGQIAALSMVVPAGRIVQGVGKLGSNVVNNIRLANALRNPTVPANYATKALPKIKELTKISANNSELLAPFKAGNLLKDGTVASIAKNMVGKTKDQILRAKRQMPAAKFKQVMEELRKIDPTIRYQYGGYIPKFQFGGSINDEHSIPVFSSYLEDFGLTELQTEKGEIAFMPDGSLPDVKAKKLHKHQDKDDVTDIMQSGTYIFSNDPKMKFGVKSKIGGVELGDMKLGKSVFKYKENETTAGPEDIMLKDMFFNGSKKELTTADIAKNIKKNLPIVDLKNDYFADRAIAENKDQRVEYLSILKAFNEFKKPKQKSIPKAQYGMPIQYSQNGLDGIMGYGDKQMDPFRRLDNNIISMFNYKQPELPSLPKPYQTGGTIPHAMFGWLADGVDYIGGWSRRAERDQRMLNELLKKEYQGYGDDLQDTIDRSGAIGIGTNLATYAAALNVPLQKYDDQSEQMSLHNATTNRAMQRLEAAKYTASQGIGSALSLARYSNPTSYSDYLAKVQSQSDSNIAKINQAMADLDMQRANANIGFISNRNAGRNQALNARDTQLYNANVQGIGNVGKSLQEAILNSGTTRYQLGNQKMAYDAYLEDKAMAAKQAKQQQIRGYTNEIGSLGLTALTGGFGGKNRIGEWLGGKKTTPEAWSIEPVNTKGFSGLDFQNPMQMSPIDQQFNPNYGGFTSYNTLTPGSIVNRNGTNIGDFRSRNIDNWNYNFFDARTWR